jgi:WD40 repeat protein/tetratricopeptide (TPR) repeat protein
MAEIEDAILSAQAYVFVVSPHSASSPVCAEEADIAARHNKKVIPVVAEDVGQLRLPPGVAARQWIDARPAQDFAAVIGTLVSAIDTDLEWIRTHTRLLQQAVRWIADSERASLLEGGELEDAEAWLKAAETHELQPTREQAAFIAASQWRAALNQAQRHYERSFELSDVGRRQAAAAHLLRAVELAPPEGVPDGYPASAGSPTWAEDAWMAYRYLDAERGRLRGRLHAPGPVSCVAIDADATVAAVGSVTGSVELWDLGECERIRSLSGVRGAVTAIALSPAHEIIAAGVDGSLFAWAADREAPRALLRSEGNPVTAIAFGPDGRQAFGLRDGHLILLDAAGNQLRRSRLHAGSITSILFDSAGSRVITGSGRPTVGEWLGEGTASSWDPTDESERVLLPGTLEGSPVTVALSPDGGAVLRSLAGGTVELFSGSPRQRRLLAHPQTVRAATFTPASETVITGCDDGIIRTWDAAQGNQQAVFDGHLRAVTCLVPSNDGTILLSGSLDTSAAVWDLGQPPARTRFAEGSSAIAVSANHEMAVGARDGSIQILNRPDGKEVATFRRPGPIISLSMSPDGSTVLAGHEDGGISVWNVASEKRTTYLADHDGTVWDLAYSPDATLAASASADGTVRLWDTSRWTLRAALTGHEGSINGVAFTSDGRQLVTCGADGTVRLWSVADGNEERTLGRAKTPLTSVAIGLNGTSVAASGEDGTLRLGEIRSRTGPRWRRSWRTIKAHQKLARRVAISPDGRLLLSASFDSSVKCWDLATTHQVRAFSEHTDSVWDVAFGPDGRTYSAGMDGALWVWNIESGNPIGSYSAPSQRLSSMALSADGVTLAAGSLEGDVYVWNTTTDQPSRTLASGHRDAVGGLAFNSDGSILASVSRDRTARLWIVETEEQVVAQRLMAAATSVAWHRGGMSLVCGTGDKDRLTAEGSEAFGAMGGQLALAGPGEGGAIVWDFHAGPPRFLERHAGPVKGIAVTPDGRILTAGDDASVRLWDPGSGRQLRLLKGHRDQVWAVAVSPDGSLAASGSIDNDVRLWDLESGVSTRVIERHEAGVGSVVFDSSGTRLVTASADGTVRIFDVTTGAELRVLRGHQDHVVAVAVDPGASRALSGTLKGELLLWDLTSTSPPRALQPHDDGIWGIAIGPDGTTAVTTSEDGTARVWDLEAAEVRHTLTARRVPLRHAAISPDGSEVAVGAADYAVRLWDLRSGDLTAILTGHWSEAVCVAYDRHGTTIACGAEDGTVRMWRRGHEDPLDWAAGQLGDVLAVDYDPAGKHILVGGDDGSLRLWDDDRGELLAVLRGHTAPVTGVRVHPDGRQAVSCSMDGSVRIWDLSAARELNAFTDNHGPVSAVLFLEDGQAILSASTDGTLLVRSTRTGRLLRRLAGKKETRFDLVLQNSSGDTMQMPFGGGARYSALALGPDGESILAGSAQDTSELRFLRSDTPKTPPRVDAELTDPYTHFQSLYQSVGLRIAHDGPGEGEVTLA